MFRFVSTLRTGTGSRRRGLRAVVGMLTVAVLGGVGLLQAPLVQAATTTYEFVGSWENPPASVKSGADTLSALWKFDINDDSPAPTNNPVQNNTVTFTAQNAKFSSVPGVCLTSGVTPASSLSADGRTLVCNIGTRNQGTAQVTFTGLVPDGKSGDLVTVTGKFRDKTVQLPTIPISNPFIMDAKFNGGAVTSERGPQQLVSFGWSLSHSKDSLPGPSTVSYDITVLSSFGETFTLDGTGCAPISTALGGFPYSDGTHAQNQSTSFPSCALLPLGGNKFRLTLSNLDYTKTGPTKDTGNQDLPAGMDVIAAGQIQLQFPYSSSGTMTLSASTPTYVAAGSSAVTSVDAAANNDNALNYTRGYWSQGFLPRGPLAGGSVWTDTYRTTAGTSVSSGTLVAKGVGNTMCVVLDTKYVTYEEAIVYSGTKSFPAATIWYFTGTGGGLLDPASASYNPNNWTGCVTDVPAASGWTTTPPADLSTVKAVWAIQDLAIVNQSVDPTVPGVGLQVNQKIKTTAPVGQDIWSWGSYKRSGTWFEPARSNNPADRIGAGVSTPGARYAFATAGRDVLRVIGSTPVIQKEVGQAEAGPGSVVDYTLRYGLSAPISAPAGPVTLVDTLPVGLSYVAGSSSLAPTISGDPSTGQKLTWNISGVQVNKTPLAAISFKASVPTNATLGSVYRNTVEASSQGQKATATADFTVPKTGYTTLTKKPLTAVAPVTGNTAEDGWTISMTSQDPASSSVTDTVDILPYNGDSRGTSFTGTYKLKQAVQTVAGAQVYYTTAAPATLKEDPKDTSNGGFGTITGNTVGWSTTYTPNATAVRVIGPALAFGQTQNFTVQVIASDNKGGDTFVNTAVGRASDTALRMRTSGSFTIDKRPATVMKKYVIDTAGTWHDAQTINDYPTYNVGDAVRYRLVVENTGNTDLSNLPVTDTKANLGQLLQEGKLTADVPVTGNAATGLKITAMGTKAKATIEYTLTITAAMVENNTVPNTACVNPEPGTTPAPAQSCDPAGIKIYSSLTWEKISAYSTTTYLEGSEWELVKVTGNGGTPIQGTNPTTITDCTATDAKACTTADKDPRAGRFKATNLTEGWYRLTETKSPSGYKIDTTPRYIQVSGETKIDKGIVNELTDVPTIPLTGGMGSTTFWITGGLSALIAAAGLLWQRRRKVA